MDTEMVALRKNGTWILVNLPEGRVPIGCKWVHKIKENPDGPVSRYKAHLVAKGFHQQEGFDFNETFSPVIQLVTIHIVLTIGFTKGWSIRQLDVNNNFLNGGLNEEIYMVQPPSFVDPLHPNKVYKLQKALYGLKQAPRAWFEKLSIALLSFGFVSAQYDHSLFVRTTPIHCTYVLVYADDILVIESHDKVVSSLISELG
uniref:Reverse transcriptase Ty1/copia-type domain-containing protein n=1 Tax=Cannabis sativa TaxID=3483 RepID=A0A803PM35_CANSA